MSVNDEQTKMLEEVEVNVDETTEMVELEKEAKKAKIVATAKKGLKIAGVAAIGVVGFLLGKSTSSKNDYNDSDVIDVDYEKESDE